MKTLALRLVDSVDAYRLFHGQTRHAATVLMMHHFCGPGETGRGVVSSDLLDSCLGYLANHGYGAIALSEYVERLRSRSGFYKSVVFTVDDGYRDFHDHAYQIFTKHRVPAAVFLATDFIDGRLPLWWDQVGDTVRRLEGDVLELECGGRPLRLRLGSPEERRRATREIVERCKELPDARRREFVERLLQRPARPADPARPAPEPLTWGQIEQMGRQGIEFFPHTLTHPILARCSSDQALREVAESKRRVHEMTGSPADIFCYPNGRLSDFDASVVGHLQAAGYIAAVTAVPGHDDVRKGVDLFRLRRYSFPDSLAGFKQLVSGLEAFKDQWR